MKQMMAILLCSCALMAQAADIKLKPGLWELTYQSDKGGGSPQLSPKQLAQLEKAGVKMGGGKVNIGSMTVKHCMSKEQAERSEPPRPKDSEKMQCEPTEYKRSGNTVTWKMVCNGERSVTGTGSMTISSAEAYAGTSTLTTRDKKHGEMTMNTSMTGKWLADTCPQK